MAENLVLRLIARTSAFEKGMGRATKRTRTLKAGVLGLGGAMKRMAGSMLAAAGIGGIGYMVKQQMVAIDANAKLSDRIGLTTESLVGLQHGAQIMGVETATLNKSLEIFTKRLGEVKMGTGEAERALEALGLSADELATKSPDEAIGAVADQIRRLETNAEKAAAANFLFGRSGVQLLNMFEEGSQGIAKYRKEVDRLGMTYSRIDAAKVEEANDAITRMKGSVTGLATELAVTIGPAIEATADGITKILEKWNQLNLSGNLVNLFVMKALSDATASHKKATAELEAAHKALEKAASRRGDSAARIGSRVVGGEAGYQDARRRLVEAMEQEKDAAEIRRRLRQEFKDVSTGADIILKPKPKPIGGDGASALDQMTDPGTPDRIEDTTVAMKKLNMTLDVNKLKWQSVAWTMENAMVSAMEAVEFEGQNLEKSMKDIARAVLVEMQRVFIFQRTAQAATGFLSGLGGSIMSHFRTPSTGPGLTPGQFSPYTPGEQFTPAFASGGITDRPSIFGEGSMKEAAVPLPDGRTIPVTMKGGGSPNIQIINQGTNQTVTDSDSIMENGQMFLRIWTDDYVNEGLTFDAVSNSRGFG